jgi:hypothetical protein
LDFLPLCVIIVTKISRAVVMIISNMALLFIVNTTFNRFNALYVSKLVHNSI